MKLYIYPTWTPHRDKSGNLYIKLFHEAFIKCKKFIVCNRMWKIGIGSTIFNLDAELFIIQWIDLIPNKRFGKIQFVLFLLIMQLLKFKKRTKIVWVMHNKHAHNGKSRLVDYGMMFMSKISDLVITHSNEGVIFFNTKYPNNAGKCVYIPHPVYSDKLFLPCICDYDYIIWGGINKRKMVAEFLHKANNSIFYKTKKILVVGKCNDEDYCKLLNKETNSNIIFINSFLSDDELGNYIRKSRFILFTYNTDSLLSSGALIYSINFRKPIIGPNSGNFADLNTIVRTYSNFDDIEKIDYFDNSAECEEYIRNNKWEFLPNKIFSALQKTS